MEEMKKVDLKTVGEEEVSKSAYAVVDCNRGQKRENAMEKVPIYQKLTLTIREAAEYSNIGINRIDQMLRAPNCTFVLYVGNKKLVKRKEFEEYIHNQLVV